MSFKFTTDLIQAQERESAFISVLSSFGFHCSQSQGLYPGYDVQAYHPSDPDSITTYEVKYQRKAETTGNIAIEVFKTIGGERKPSGLTATTADWWVLILPGRDCDFYLIRPLTILQLLKDGHHKAVLWGGDKGTTTMAIFEKDKFLSFCETL